MTHKRSPDDDPGSNAANPGYVAEVTAIGGREGFAQSSDRRLRLELCQPSGRCGDRAKGTDPEQLIAAAYASCFLSALRQAARETGAEIAADANVTARVEFDEAVTDASGLRIDLIVDLPGLDPVRRRSLVDRAHEISRCSRALRRSVAVRTLID